MLPPPEKSLEGPNKCKRGPRWRRYHHTSKKPRQQQKKPYPKIHLSRLLRNN
ncbi:hypothetical protein JG688_00015443 [Phytophthora aleatoria]|uniref:Uncharacterized protein n=1 Tax=Phytophthora aleatoria TaxID=2496075 RepID=A0A8J5IZG7_9STRA|nr:hypothetical protein JG688_00015443 [Phytophthora aleatoria]